MATTVPKRARLSRRQRGIAIVEFTIAVPLLIILIMATAEFARAFWQYNTLTKTVQDGARHLAGKSLVGSTGTVSISAALVSETRNLVVYGNPLGAGSPVLPGFTTSGVTVADVGGGNVRVTAAYPYGSIFAFIPQFIYGADVNVSAYTFQTAVTMRAL